MGVTQTIEGAGVALACRVQGDGPAVLLVHDMASDARRWEPVAQALARAGARPLTYDRRGYGASGAPEPYERTTVQEQSQDALAVLDALTAGSPGAPAATEAPSPGPLACGEGFGALVVLDLLLRAPGRLRGAVLVAPPLHQLSDAATEALSDARAMLEQALRDEGPAAAVTAWRPDADTAVRAAHRAFFADLGGIASLPITRAELRRLTVPVAVVTGPDTPAHVVQEADALAALIPAARRTRDGDPLAPLQALLSASS
jgi:pimeloyl-ACP methyl ester carboxylesterase